MCGDLSDYKITRATSRLILESLTLDNMSPDYFSWLQDPDVLRYLEIRHSKQTETGISDYVTNMLGSKDNLLLGIFTAENKQHIGNIKLGPIDWLNLRASIGIIIGDKSFWGKGYASDAVRETVKIASDIGLKKVQAGAYGSNLASVKVFEKAGFDIEGTLKSYWLHDGGREDLIYLGKCL